ncbi:MAG: hypothetical protein V4582_12700 [Pseudomonadota bacterium]
MSGIDPAANTTLPDASSTAVLATVPEPGTPAGVDCAATSIDGSAAASFADSAGACAAPTSSSGAND